MNFNNLEEEINVEIYFWKEPSTHFFYENSQMIDLLVKDLNEKKTNPFATQKKLYILATTFKYIVKDVTLMLNRHAIVEYIFQHGKKEIPELSEVKLKETLVNDEMWNWRFQLMTGDIIKLNNHSFLLVKPNVSAPCGIIQL